MVCAGAGPGFVEHTRDAGGRQNGQGGNPADQGQGGQGGGGYDRSVISTPTAALVPNTTVSVNDAPAQTMKLDEGANVEELVNGLHAIGTTARDVVAILQAIKAEGGIQADLEVQ
jgi:hypothetical protein